MAAAFAHTGVKEAGTRWAALGYRTRPISREATQRVQHRLNVDAGVSAACGEPVGAGLAVAGAGIANTVKLLTTPVTPSVSNASFIAVRNCSGSLT